VEIAGVEGEFNNGTVARFGPFEFNCQTGELWKHGVRVRLQGKPAQLLRSLIEHHGQVVTRDQLKDKLWPSDIFVDFESGLNTAANRLRFALGDSAEHPLYIETLPKVGYRFVAPVAFASPSKLPARDELIELKPSVHPQSERSPELPVALPGVSASLPFIQAPHGPRLRRRPVVAITAGCALVGIVLLFHLNPLGTAPSFQQVTFSRGFVSGARFMPDGKAIVYSASWNGAPNRVFLLKRASPEPEVLHEGPAWLTGISPKGEAAIFRHLQDSGQMILESLPIQGGKASFLSDHAKSADWGPDGSLCLVLADSSGYSINYPKDRPLYRSTGWISNPRISHDGRRIAFLEHPLESDDAGRLVVVDTSGNARVLSAGWASIAGLAWHSSRPEIWFTAARSGVSRILMAVDLKGNVRQVAQIPGGMVLQDVNAKGDVLIARTNPRMAMFHGNLPDGSVEDISLLDWSRAVTLTPDGRLLLFDESGEGGGRLYSVYLYRTASRTLERLTEGRAMDLSTDGRWALTQAADDPSRITLIAVSPRQSKPVSTYGLTYQWAKFIPDSECPEILLGASQPGHALQLYRQELPSGHPHLIANDVELSNAVISDEGDFAAGLDRELRISVLNLDTGAIRSVSNPKSALPVRFIDETKILTSHYEDGSIVFNLLDTANGEKRLYRRFELTDNTGVAHISPLGMSRDMKQFVYSRLQTLSGLFIVSGWN
jgi:DNA-binding winged helix-turn-helix (wHTH) protein/Tol biopolymer transport system component